MQRRFLAVFLPVLCATACDQEITSAVTHEEPGEVGFEFGEIGENCTDTNLDDSITYDTRTEGGTFYCKISALWDGVLLDMVRIREGVESNLREEGMPEDQIDDVDVRFTDLEITDVEITLARDEGDDVVDVAFPDVTFYTASARVDGVSGLITAEWPNPEDEGAGPSSPHLSFFDETGLGTKDDLLDHLDEAYAAGAEIDASGDSVLEFVYTEEDAERVSGSFLRVKFKIVVDGEGVASIGSLVGG
jgi:hypothetical protein